MRLFDIARRATILAALLYAGATLAVTPPQNVSALIVAAETGDTHNVKQLLGNGADVNGRDPVTRLTPLLAAVMAGKKDAAGYLLDHGADVNLRLGGVTPDSGLAPIHAALMYADEPEMLAQLLKKGANIEARDDSQSTPLLWAAARGRVRSFKLLVARRANIDTVDINEHNLLYWATLAKCDPIISLLKHRGMREK